jgi:prepilin-type N-terminal cleavage/methylation domain-containing protein
MTHLPQARSCSGFTLKELLIVIAVMVVVTLLALPSFRSAKRKAQRIGCFSNLMQISLAHRLWSGDFGGTNCLNASQVSTNAGGALEPAVQGQVWRVFQLMSNELNTPKILTCPTDTRRRAGSFSLLSNPNLSYFIGLDANENHPQSLLSGDRNLEVASQPLAPGVVTVATNQPVGWTDAQHQRCGNVGLADGSGRQLSNAGLRAYLVEQGLATNRLVIP